MVRTFLIGALALACSGDTDSPTDESGTDTGTLPKIVETEPYRTVTPIFEWTADRLEANDRLGYRFYVPENPVGIVWSFHGANGGMGSVQQTEWIVVYNQLVQRGIGVVITQSTDRKGGDWVREADIPRIEGIKQAMVNQYKVIDDDTPMGVLAFSGGSGMAAMMEQEAVARGWNLRVMSLHQGGVPIYSMPTFYIAAENDETGRDRSAYEDAGFARECRQKAGDCPLREGKEVVLDPRRFGRLEGVAKDRSPDIFQEMVDFGMVDDKGVRLADISTKELVAQVFDDYLRRSQFPSDSLAATQLRVVWATHRLSAEFATQEADFMLQYLQE